MADLDTFLSCVHVGTFSSLSDRGTTISKFAFSRPVECAVSPTTVEVKGHPEVDEDGDLVVQRRNQCLSIEHAMSTSLQDVGLQVWRGALIMADYLLHSSDQFKGATVLELGGGSGLVSIVAAMVAAKTVICTDIGENILDLCQRNVVCNLVDLGLHETVLVRELNWCDPFHSKCEIGSKYTWREDDHKRLGSLTFILAADVIYEDSLTDSLLSCLLYLCDRLAESPPTILVSLEKRINFTLEDLAPSAPSYRHFMQCLARSHTLPNGSRVKFSTEAIPIEDLPQYFQYERVNELELWKIRFQKEVVSAV